MGNRSDQCEASDQCEDRVSEPQDRTVVTSKLLVRDTLKKREHEKGI